MKRPESSKSNYDIISPRVIIKAINHPEQLLVYSGNSKPSKISVRWSILEIRKRRKRLGMAVVGNTPKASFITKIGNLARCNQQGVGGAE